MPPADNSTVYELEAEGAAAAEQFLRACQVGKAIGKERTRFANYALPCRADGCIAFDDDPFETVSLFVAMAAGEWRLASALRAP